MAKVGMDVVWGTQLDLKGVHDGLGKMQKEVESSKPFEFNVKSGGDLSILVGDAKQFFDEMDSGVKNVEKVTVQYAKFADLTKNGAIYRIPISGLREVRDATGKVVIETEKWNAAQIKADKANKNMQYLGISTATSNVGATTRKLTADYSALAKELDNNVKTADRFLAKSNNMSGRQVDDAKKVANALKAEKAEFDKLFGASVKDWDAIGAKGEKVRQLARELDKVKQSTNAGANAFQNWGERISNAIKQTISYAVSIKLVQDAQRLFNEAVKYAIDLNTEMTKIQVLQAEGAQTPEQITALADSFNKLGQAMGASTLEIAKGSVEWFRQGRTVEETQKLMISSLELAKLGAMSSADATNYLTSITNAFSLSADQTSTVVDKLIAVDNIAATSAGELATAMRYTSESAAIAGVSMEQLVSYIGTVSTVTRQNAEMIGQAFKTMFARMTQIQGGGLDETGQSISKVEAALKKVNIEVKNADGSWLGMGDVLEQVAAKWNTINTREQVEIATAVAGVRQKEAFLVLMGNMDKALKYQAAQVDSLGLANERYGIYLESVEAKQGKIQAQLQELFTKTINSDTIKKVLDLGSAFLQLVDNIGGLEPILIIITGLLIAMKAKAIGGLITSLPTFILSLAGMTAAEIATSGATASLSLAFQTLLASIGPVGWIIMAIGAAIGITGGAIAYNNSILAKQKKAFEDSKTAVDNYIDSVNKMPEVMSSAGNTIQQINDILAKTGARSEEDQAKLDELFAKLYELAPSLQGWKFNDGKPFLPDDAIPTVTELEKSVEDLNVSTLLAGQSLDTYMKGQDKAFQYAVNAANLAKTIQDGLSDIYNNFEVPEKAQESVGKLWSSLMKIDSNSEMFKALPQDVKDAYTNTANLLSDIDLGGYGKPLSETFRDQLSAGIANGSSLVATNTDAANKVSDAVAILVSNAIGSGDNKWKPFLENWADALANSMGDSLVNAANSKIVYPEIGNPLERGGYRPPVPETDIDKLARQNKEYEDALKLVNRLAPAITKLNTALAKEGDNATDVNQAVRDLNIELEAMANESGIDFTVKSFDELANATKTGLDPEKVSAYRDQLIQWLSDNENLKVSNDTMYNMVLQLLDTLDGKVHTVSVTLTDTLGNSFTMTANKAQEATQWLADSVYNMGKDANGAVQIALNNGAQITVQSSQQILQLMADGYLSWATLVDQATAYAAQRGYDLVNTLGKLLAGLSSGQPYFTPPPIGGGGGGGGGGGKKPNQDQIDAIEKEIKRQQELKKEIEDKIKQYKEYIALQKESLQRAKEEADFQDELAGKHKEVAKIKARLAILALDDSEEAQAERAKLEEELAKKEEDITKTNEDRKYELQVQGLDDVQKAFEDAMQAQIDAIDDVIESLNKEKEALQDVADASGSGGSAGIAFKDYSQLVHSIVDDLKIKYGEYLDSLNLTPGTLEKLATMWLTQGDNIDTVMSKLDAYIEKVKKLQDELKKANPDFDTWNPTPNPTPPEEETGTGEGPFHQGGIVESHHRGEFAGNLMSNEVFAKLLKGEYIATEPQMNNFIKNILPRIATGISPKIGYNRVDSSKQVGDIKLDVDINVAGSLDRSVLPDIEKSVLKVINKALEIRGIRRTANNFSA